MNNFAVGDYVVNLDAIAWANMNFQWTVEVPSYVMVNGFKTFEGSKREKRGGVLLHFVDGSTLTIPDGTPGIKYMRTILNPDGRKESETDAYSPTENEILTGLPEDLRAAILKGEQ